MAKRMTLADLQQQIADSDVTIANDYLEPEPVPDGRVTHTIHTVALTLPSPPSWNRLYRVGNKRIHKTNEAKQYTSDVRWMAKAANIIPIDGDVFVTLHWYRPRKAGDIDNRLKIVLDSLEGAAYHDDKQVAGLTIWRHEDKDNPRLEVQVRQHYP